MIKGLAHLCFNVNDLDESIAFYRDKLGCKVAFEFTNDQGKRFGVYIHLGGRNFIELFQGEVGSPDKGQSYKHFCIEVDDIEKTVQVLRERGVDATDVKMGSDNSWQAWLEDPDGNRIELHHYTPESLQAPSLE